MIKRRFVTPQELRHLIKQRRIELGYSLQDLGSKVDIDRNTIKLTEDGKIKDPGVSRILRILSALDLDASSLMAPIEGGSHLEEILLLIDQEPLLNRDQKNLLSQLILIQANKHMRIKRILLVDDQEIFLKGARALLEKRGYEVETADCYRQALNKLKNGHIDLVLIDIDLKEEKNGLDLLRDIHESSPNLPCVMLSGIRNQQFARQAMEQGAFDYIDKNEDMDKVFLVIKKIEDFNKLHTSQTYIEQLIQ